MRLRLAALLGLLLLGAVAVAEGAGAPGTSGPAHRPRSLGPVDPGQSITASLVLRLPGERRLHRFLAATADPRSPAYGRTLEPAAFGSRFGLGRARLARTRAALAARGLRVVEEFPQRTELRISGRAKAVERVFSTKLVSGVDARGRPYRAPTGKPRIPAWLSGVLGVTGLDTRPSMEPAGGSARGLGPGELANAYDFARLHAQGVTGAGQTVAVVSFHGSNPQDLANYVSLYHLPPADLSAISIDGGPTPETGQLDRGDTDEVNLDLDMIHAVAPGAKILNFEAPNGPDTPGDVVNRIVLDGRAKVISDSWGQCELNDPGVNRTSDEHAFDAARAAGISVFAAAGDSGAYDCRSKALREKRLAVDWPAASRSVVGVGGTRLFYGSGGQYVFETGWETTRDNSGGGGGLSAYVKRPSWQVGVGVKNPYSTGKRQVPDVAGPADPASGVVVATRGGYGGPYGGTSAAAPFWAGGMAMIRNSLARAGSAEPTFVLPLLYRIAAKSDPSAFHDVRIGGNLYYLAGPGWDYSTGLGTPDFAELAGAIAKAMSAPG